MAGRFLSLLPDNVIKATRLWNIGALVPPLQISSNTITVSQSWHQVIAVGTVTERSLRRINGGVEGDVLVLQRSLVSPGDVIIDDGVNNIESNGDFTLTSDKDTIGFVFDGADWCELFRSNNA